MKSRYFSILALAALVSFSACKADGDGDVVEQDTSAIPGTDTIDMPTVVPTTDSVVTTTTVDTMEGDVPDSVADSVVNP